MGIPYEHFLAIFAAANLAFGILSQAERNRRASLHSTVVAQDGFGPLLVFFSWAGQAAWLALMVIGFLSLRWYLALALFIGPGIAGGMAYAFMMPPHRYFGSPAHNIIAGISGIAVAAATIFLWVQRSLH